MKNCTIDVDEWYPVYEIHVSREGNRQINDEDLAFIEQAFEQFEKAQEMLLRIKHGELK